MDAAQGKQGGQWQVERERNYVRAEDKKCEMKGAKPSCVSRLLGSLDPQHQRGMVWMI